MKLDHIAINVSDIKKSIEWYVQNLSASVDYEDQTWAMLNVNNTRLALTISQGIQPKVGVLSSKAAHHRFNYLFSG